MFGGIFPSQWSQPLPRHWKPVKSLAAHQFPQRTLRISKPGPETVPAPVKVAIPECERCLGEVNDFSEIDRMLAEMDNPSDNAKARQILRTIEMVKNNIEKNIKAIEDAPVAKNDTVSRTDISALLKGFLNFVRTVENHIKESKCFC